MIVMQKPGGFAHLLLAIIDGGLAWTLLFWPSGFSGSYEVLRRRFRNALDNSGDSVGFVVDWLALPCRRQSHPLVARCGRGRVDYQSRDRPSSCLRKLAADFTQMNADQRQSALSAAKSLFAGPW